MKFLKSSQRKNPRVSLVLLDWSVRESFHLLHYLSEQSVPRDQFEVIIIEYYSTVSPAIKKFEEHVDQWILLEMPQSAYYHKHLMYNVGIIHSYGDIVVVCDSDTMVSPRFIETIIESFDNAADGLVLHMDQFRNNRKDLYPFCYPSIETVLGPGCINNTNGKTTGLARVHDILHTRNYGACFCAKKEDLIAIGGADEHIDFVGHICGPYDFTFRLINHGRHERWHGEEFIYHTWHPGQDGVDNYLGPHDGRNVSTTSLNALITRRVQPHVINPAIAQLQKNNNADVNQLADLLISGYVRQATNSEFLSDNAQVKNYAANSYVELSSAGFVAQKTQNGYSVKPLIEAVEKNSRELKSLEDVTQFLTKMAEKNHITFSQRILILYIKARTIFRVLKYILTRILKKFVSALKSFTTIYPRLQAFIKQHRHKYDSLGKSDYGWILRLAKNSKKIDEYVFIFDKLHYRTTVLSKFKGIYYLADSRESLERSLAECMLLDKKVCITKDIGLLHFDLIEPHLEKISLI